MIIYMIQYNLRLAINLILPPKEKSSKSAFRRLLPYFLLFNNNLIELTFNIFTLLLVKRPVGCFMNNLCLYYIGKLSKLAF